MTTQEKLDRIIAILRSNEFNMLFDKAIGIDNVGGEESFRNIINTYIEELYSFGDLDAYDDDEDASTMVEDFIRFPPFCVKRPQSKL